jgi:hypothetical protein
MALTVAVGGILMSVSLALRPALIVTVLAGAAIALLELPRLVKMTRASPPGRILWPAALAAVWYAPTVILRWHNGCDDDIAYFTFVKRILDTGTLIEPFSLRRLAAYGGHSFLQALVWAMGSQKNLQILDIGISGLVLAGIVYGACRKLVAKPAYAILLAAAAVLMPVPRINCMSQGTGLVLFLTLFRTFQLVRERGFRTRDIVVIGLIASAVCALRDNYIPAAILACVFGFLADAHMGSIRPRIVKAIGSTLATFLFLLPWMIVLYRSSGSLLYPLMHGNHQPSFNTYSANMNAFETLQAAGSFFLYFSTAIIVIPAILLAWSALDRLAFAQIGAGIVTAAMTALSFTYTNNSSLFRYAHAFLAAALLVSLFTALDFHRTKPKRSLLSGRLFASGVAILAAIGIPAAIAGPVEFGSHLFSLPKQLADTAPFYEESKSAAYGRLQSLFPAGSSILAMVAEPSLLAYGGRYSVMNIDIPGACSPDSGMPSFQGATALSAYLQSHQIDFVLYSDFDSESCLYYRARWLCQSYGRNCDGTPVVSSFCPGSTRPSGKRPVHLFDPDSRLNDLWTVQGRYYVDLMDNIDQLAASQDELFCDAGLRLLRLKKTEALRRSPTFR